MTEDAIDPDAPAARWSYPRVVTAPGPDGQPVEVVTGLVDTPDGPIHALRVGDCVIHLDDTLTSNLVIDLLRAKEWAAQVRDEAPLTTHRSGGDDR